MFQKATRQRVYLKLNFKGPSGSGKSWSALALATGLADGGKIAAIDTENGSLSLYADHFDFDVITLERPFKPDDCVKAINAAVTGGYSVLVIDSGTHFWQYILQQKEQIDARGGNSYTNWGKVKPQYERLTEAILQSKIHIIVCYRAKDEIVLESDSRGKQVPKKVGMAAISEPGSEFEYTVSWDVAMDHTSTPSKDRTGLFADTIVRIAPDHGKKLLDWLGSAKSQEFREVSAAEQEHSPATVTRIEPETPAQSTPTRKVSEEAQILKDRKLPPAAFRKFKDDCGSLGLDWQQLTRDLVAIDTESTGQDLADALNAYLGDAA